MGNADRNGRGAWRRVAQLVATEEVLIELFQKEVDRGDEIAAVQQAALPAELLILHRVSLSGLNLSNFIILTNICQADDA
jgi:hypothetical protein